MGGRLKGHRMMITCPAEVYPELKRYAQLFGVPEAHVIRAALEGLGPELKNLNDAMEAIRSGSHVTGATAVIEALARAAGNVHAQTQAVTLTATDIIRNGLTPEESATNSPRKKATRKK